MIKLYKQISRIIQALTVKDTLAEQRKAKKLIVQITNTKEKEDIQQTTTKDLIEKIQEKASKVIEISCFPNSDIKEFTKTKKTKETLEKDIIWTKPVAKSAEVSWCIYRVTVHGVKVQNVDTANQT